MNDENSFIHFMAIFCNDKIDSVDNEIICMLLFQCYTNVAPLLQPHGSGNKLNSKYLYGES